MAPIVAMFTLLIAALAMLPAWPYSRNWTFYPAGVCCAVVMTVVLLGLVGRL